MVQAAKKTEKTKNLVKRKNSEKLHHQAWNRRQNNKVPVHNDAQGLGTRLHSITSVYIHVPASHLQNKIILLKSTRNSSYFSDTTLSGWTQKHKHYAAAWALLLPVWTIPFSHMMALIFVFLPLHSIWRLAFHCFLSHLLPVGTQHCAPRLHLLVQWMM